MTRLAPGANAPIGANGVVAISVGSPSLGGRFALATVPCVGEAAVEGAYTSLGSATAWAQNAPSGATIALSSIPTSVTKLIVCLYAIRSAGSFREIGETLIAVDGHEIGVRGADLDRSYSCLILAEIYRRGDAWKVRSLMDGFIDGLPSLGRRLGVALDDEGPTVIGPDGSGSGSPSPGGDYRPPFGAPNWTGSGFAVAARLFITNAHVVEDASSITVAGFDGQSPAASVIVDRANDLALVRTQIDLEAEALAFRSRGGPGLGETAVALGYPLSGLLSSGPQVTQGSVSSLLGPQENASLMQVSAPIQPGSSGGPLLDMSGAVIGVIVASLTNAQNVNFAIRGALAEALVDAAGFDPRRATDGAALDLQTIVRKVRKSIWRLECRR